MNSQVEQLLSTLRDQNVRLGWIADEIVNSIQLGKPSEKYYAEPGQKKRKRGQYTEPLNEREEMETAIRVLRSYFVDLRRVWLTAQSAANESLLAAYPKVTPRSERLRPASNPSGPFKLVLQDSERAEVLTPFSEAAERQMLKLAELLDAATREEQLEIRK